MSHIHIHAPQPTEKRIQTGVCPDCKKRSRFIAFFTPWYGDHTTCLRCGREWMDGEWMPLPFIRGSRKITIAAAKKRWRTTRLALEA